VVELTGGLIPGLIPREKKSGFLALRLGSPILAQLFKLYNHSL
jgi:hypothetical protein